MREILFGKYKNIVVSIALFLLLDASVLISNFYISYEISEDAQSVNLAGRQRMLSQRMVKSLLDIEYSSERVVDRGKSLAELQLTLDLFDSTLDSFDVGGVTRGANNDDVYISAVSSNVSLAAVSTAKEIWKPYKVLLKKVLEGPSVDSSDNLTAAINYGRLNNLALLKSMNNLTVELELIASSKATRLRIIQTVGILLAVINFFIIMFHFIRQLKDGDRRVESARNETLEILENVNEGLFLIDESYTIASQYSRELEIMFARKDIAGMSLDELLNDVVSEKYLIIARRFISLLYRSDIRSNLIADLNPLTEVEVTISEEDGSFITKYLRFSFSRAYESGVIKDILVTVTDVSSRVLLERELAITKEQGERQVEVLTSILHANPDYLRSFISDLFVSFQKINSILMEPSKKHGELKKKLSMIFIEVHRIKGEASSLNLETFMDLTHGFEEQLITIQKLDRVSGDDFLPLVVRLETLVRHAEIVRSLVDKISLFSLQSHNDGGDVMVGWDHLNDLVHNVSARCDKQVELVCSGLNEHKLTESLKSLINDIAIQGIRNAIIHGIETEEDRRVLQKQVKGRIDVRLAVTSSGDMELSVKDDGYGIDFDAIRANAISSGRITEQQAESWTGKQLLSLIFEPGFSTATEHNFDAGSGVGMDLIKSRVTSMRGKIRVHSKRGYGTKIQVTLPRAFSHSIAA
ncbi:MAG: two-component system chemotaxis sensor kinase CheA [Flavobacteriales bacterium]